MEIKVKCSEDYSELLARVQTDTDTGEAWLEVEPCAKCKIKATAITIGCGDKLTNF